MKLKIKPADTWFSKCVRESYDWTCQKCGTKYERGSQGLHCSHHYPRGNKSTRFASENATALCFGCHRIWHSDPVGAFRWLLSVIGEGALDLLTEKKNQIFQMKKHHWKEAAAHYRAEHAKLMEQRDAGATGPLEFESWQ